MSINRVGDKWINCDIAIQWDSTQCKKEWSTDTHKDMSEYQSLMLSDKKQTQKCIYFMITFIWNFK